MYCHRCCLISLVLEDKETVLPLVPVSQCWIITAMTMVTASLSTQLSESREKYVVKQNESHSHFIKNS